MIVKAKKHLGQHFLNDLSIARQTAEYIKSENHSAVVEVGPGMGVLTQYLLEQHLKNYFVIELDKESVQYLKKNYRDLQNSIVEGDFLKFDLTQFGDTLAVVGNFPYNISSQIIFKVLENKHFVNQLTGMFQKEVAERICAKPGKKDYGILSVLTQAYYTTEYHFTIGPEKFSPPPKVDSAVISIYRKPSLELPCSEKTLRLVVKTAFNQRRKTLRNALKQLNLSDEIKALPEMDLRPEKLSVEQYLKLGVLFEQQNA